MTQLNPIIIAMKKSIFYVAVLCSCALCAYLIREGFYACFWTFTTLSAIGLFVILPILKQGWLSYLYVQYIGNPVIGRVISRFIQYREHKLSNEWLERIEHVKQKDIPVINWVEDTQRSYGLDSFYCLDQYSDDIRQLLHRSYDVVRNDKLWFISKFTNEYYFDPEHSPAPRYEMHKNGDRLSITTGSKIDTWIYLVSKQKCPAVYAMEFDYIPHTEMKETLQIDFCCHSLSRRFRFLLENNRTLKFDVTDRGCFVYYYNIKEWNKYKKPCSLPLHKTTHIRLEIINDVFAIYYDGILQMAIRVRGYEPCPTDWYLVFWNGVKKEQAMSIEISNFKLSIPQVTIKNDTSFA